MAFGRQHGKKNIGSKPKAAHHSRESKTRVEEPTALQEEPVPIELQQTLLNIYHNAFPHYFNPELPAILQAVKKHLFERDFAAAFGKEEYLKAYASRWTPSRSLAYVRVFKEVFDVIREFESYINAENNKFRVVSLGGGAGAELVALGGLSRLFHDFGISRTVGLDLKAIDIAAWGSTLESLYATICAPPPLSKYAAAHVKAANTSLTTPSALTYEFMQKDILDMLPEDIGQLVQNTNLITIFFTLNELFTTSISKANALLLRLKNHMPIGSFLLVVDSAGSYATVSLNGNENKYPLPWLLDHIMLRTDKSHSSGNGVPSVTTTDALGWEKLQSEDSRWFRIPEELKYPLELENMRYQLHLYRRTDVETPSDSKSSATPQPTT